MSDDNIYYILLKRLNNDISGSSDFEKIGRIIAKFMYPEYDFRISEGGQGTKDSGYDGRDPIRRAKLACSTNKNYKEKIKSEVDKSKENGDLEIIYFSNQVIPGTKKISMEKEISDEGIKLYISGIDELSKKIEEYFKKNNDADLYDLLKVSSLKVGESYNRGDIKPFNDINIDKPYKKKVVIIDRNTYGTFSETIISNNPLLEFLISCLLIDCKYSLKNISICGIGYLGKSFLMKSTFNYLIKEFSNKNNYIKYKFLPYIKFCELKYYSKGTVKDLIKNNVDPFLVFLDGLDELNEAGKIELNNEIHNILRVNIHINFIISGRNSSFIDFDVFDNSFQLSLLKYIDYDDTELMKLIDEYKNTPIEDLLSIPMYRNYVIEKKIPRNTNMNNLYSLLVIDNFKKDKKRRDYSNKITSRITSENMIDEIMYSVSEFCYNLFINNKNVFSEIEIKNCFTNNDNFIFIIYSSIIDCHDNENISFISNFYFEYFVVNALLTKETENIIECFFLREKIYIPYIDVLVLFLNVAKTKSPIKYEAIIKEIKKDSEAIILLSEFDLIEKRERYNYFKKIFEEYKKKNFRIYYSRFIQTYGTLKNIDNMAQRMQLLLPDNYKPEAVKFLRKEINNFLKHPQKRYSISFCNAVCLLCSFIGNKLWAKEEQIILKELSIKLIKFFIKNNPSKEFNKNLSEEFIFDWYHNYKWINGWDKNKWENFYKDISGNSCDLFSEIYNEIEFTIKYNIFRISFKDNRPLLFPLIRYVIKNKFIDKHYIEITIPEILKDDFVMPIIKTDDRIFELMRLLKEMNIDISEIIDLLNYAIENNVYDHTKDFYENPIKYFEEVLYNNINLIAEKDFDKFSKYYFYVYEQGVKNRLFSENEKITFIDLADYLIKEIIARRFLNRNTGTFLYRLINFTDPNCSIKSLNLINEKMPKSVYLKVIDCIYKNPKHILHSNEFIINKYNLLFKEEIDKEAERDKRIEEIKKKIELVKSKDLLLMQDIDKMINEIKEINTYLLSSEISNSEETKITKLLSLYHESIINTIMCFENNSDTPIFSECAIKILENFYQDNILDVDIIAKRLRDCLLKKENFYSYFYYYFIKRSHSADNDNIIEKMNEEKLLVSKIIESIDIDIKDKFLNKPIDFFENNYEWLIPFFFYYKTLLNNKRPVWMKDEHVLKLIVIPEPTRIINTTIGNDLTLNWIIEMFPTITPDQIVKYGIKIIGNINNPLSRMMIIKYFVNCIQEINEKELKDKINKFIICNTKLLFEVTSFEQEYSRFKYIAEFWRECEINFIDIVFPKFSVKMVISAIRKDNKDVNYQYRKDVLLYCCRVADKKQKVRIIRDIDSDIKYQVLNNEEKNEIKSFLASLGKEEAIKYMIRAYLRGKDIPSRYSYNNYPIAFIEVNNGILKDYIDLFFYSTAKSSERRTILYHMAQTGIKQHLNKNNFYIFKKRMKKEIKKQTKLSSWKSETYNSYLLQMEQSIFSNSLSLKCSL